jgi:hypothetical protein
MKQQISLIITIVAFILFGFINTNAADTANITATVTFQQISLTATSGTISYGTVAASGTADTVALSQSQTITNTGNVSEDFDIKGLTPTTGGTCTHWTLKASGAPAANEYGHSWSINGGTLWTRFTDTYSEFVSNKAANATATLDLKVTMPSASDCMSAQAIDVTTQASAH